MTARTATLTILAAAGLLLGLLIIPEKDRLDVALIWVGILPLIIVQGAKAGRQMILDHAHIVRVAGLVLLAGGLTGLASHADLAPLARSAMVIGAYLVAMPHLTRRLDVQTRAYQFADLTPGSIDPVKEIASLARQLPALAGPLHRALRAPLILLGLLCVFAFALDKLNTASLPKGESALFGLVLVILLTTFIVLLYRSAISWVRFVALGTAALDSPPTAGMVWGWFWRFMVYSSITGNIKSIRPQLVEHLPMAAPWQIEGLLVLIGFGVATVLSPYALILIAIALGDPDKSMTAAMVRARTAGRKILLGMAIILSPLAAATWAFAVWSDKAKGWAGLELIAAYGLLAVVTMVFAVTFLTRAYVASADKNPTIASAKAAVPTSPA